MSQRRGRASREIVEGEIDDDYVLGKRDKPQARKRIEGKYVGTLTTVKQLTVKGAMRNAKRLAFRFNIDGLPSIPELAPTADYECLATWKVDSALMKLAASVLNRKQEDLQWVGIPLKELIGKKCNLLITERRTRPTDGSPSVSFLEIEGVEALPPGE